MSTRPGAFCDASFGTKTTDARDTVWHDMSELVPGMLSQITRFCGVSRTLIVMPPSCAAELEKRKPAPCNVCTNMASSSLGFPKWRSGSGDDELPPQSNTMLHG